MNNPQPWWLTWPVAEVGATILPLFSSYAQQPAAGMPRAIVDWCTTGEYREPVGHTARDASRMFEDPDLRAIAEAIQVLQQAGLLMQSWGQEFSYIGLTRRGWHALQTNTVRQHLGLSEPSA